VTAHHFSPERLSPAGVAPLLPPLKPGRYRHPGRRPIDDRAALAGIVFVLKTEITWNQLPSNHRRATTMDQALE